MSGAASLHLATPSTFPLFPYASPYTIQTELMAHLYTAIEAGQVTIVESPTGTVGRPLQASASQNQIESVVGEDSHPFNRFIYVVK